MHAFLERLAAIWQPHPGQREFLLNPSKTKVLACGRRWGKTDVCAAQIVASLFRAMPAKHVVIAPTADQASILFDRTLELLTLLLEHEGEAERPKVRRTPYPRFDFRGHRLTARSGHLGHTLRGQEATDIVIDEAAFVPEALIPEIASPMLATTGGTLTLISTPRGQNHFWRFFEQGRKGQHGIWSRRAPTWESPHIVPGFLETQRELISDRAFRVEYGAEFLDASGRVFRTDAIDACLVAAFDAPPKEPFYIGVDWARYSDYTAVAVVSREEGGGRLVHIERFHDAAWRDQVRRVSELAHRFSPAHVRCDATAIGDVLEEMLRGELRGASLKGEVFTASSKAALIDRLASLIEDGRIRMSPHPDLIRELQHFESKPTPSGHQRLGAMQGYHDDLVIALALACAQLPKPYAGGCMAGPERRFSAEKEAGA